MGNKMGITKYAGDELYLINEAMSRKGAAGFAKVRKKDALKGRTAKMVVEKNHAVNGNLVVPPFPEGTQVAMFGMGCFWGPEKLFWNIEGVYSTQVGYAMGYTPNPVYREVCSEKTGHTEVVRVVFDPNKVSYVDLLSAFWQNHDPTMGMAQGNDHGARCRSGIYYYGPEQMQLAVQSKDLYGNKLRKCRYKPITTEILPADQFYYAEDYHQQYLHKNVGGDCGNKGTGISCTLQLVMSPRYENGLLTVLTSESEDNKDDNSKDDNSKDDNSKDDNSKDDNNKDDNNKDDNSKDDNNKDDSKDDKNRASCSQASDKQTHKIQDGKNQESKNEPSEN